LHVHEKEKELVVNSDQLVAGPVCLKKAEVVSKIDKDQTKQGIEKAEHEEAGLKPRAEKAFPGIAEEHQKT
jgi:hypothetical protein